MFYTHQLLSNPDQPGCYDLHKWEWKQDMVEPDWGMTGSVACMSMGAHKGSKLNNCIGSPVSTSFVEWV